MLTNEGIRRLMLEYKDRMKFTWEEVADRSGVSIHTIYKFIYNQTKSMNVDSLVSVLDAMGMELAILNKESGRKCSE